MKYKKILLNRAQCRLCGDVITSEFRHDIKSCLCGEITVDGGLDYIRRGAATTLDNIIELSEFEEIDLPWSFDEAEYGKKNRKKLKEYL